MGVTNAHVGTSTIPKKGDPKHDIPAGTKFEDLPDDWRCPRCKRKKEKFVMKAEWVDGFEIRVTAEKGETVISANREGMLSLAKQLRMLADRVPGDHIHYDENNSLEEGSAVMIIERI